MIVKLRRVFGCLVFLIGLISLASSCRGPVTYYVAPDGNDANPGSPSQPWRTIQKAAERMVAGDTVLIHAGVYPEKVVPQHSGSAGKYITYKNYGDGDVIIDAGGGVRSASIEVTQKEYLQFIGLHLKNAGYQDLNAAFAAFAGSHHLILDGILAESSRFGIMMKGSKTGSEDPDKTVSFVTIKNSTIRNNAAYGIFLYYKVTDSVIGPNNKIYNENATNGVPEDDQYGIDLDTDYPGNPVNGPRRITIIGNEIYGNRIQGIRPWNSQDLLIKNNYIHHNGATGIQIEDGCANVIVDGNRSEYNAQGYEYESGIWIDSAVDVLVQNNISRGNQIGLMVTAAKNILLRNNVIYENNRAPSGENAMGVVINASSSAITFVQNTLWRNGRSASRGNLAYCIKPVTNTVIKNNIFSESAGSNDGWMNCALASDYNDFYNPGALNMNWMGSDLSWDDYRAGSGQDPHSITANPLFANPTAGDFSLAAGSPDIDSGGFLTQTTASGSGTSVPVGDSRYFSAGFGLQSGDQVVVGNEPVTVVKVDPAANLLTIDRSISWKMGDGVSYAYSGKKPDLGALESGR